MSASFIRDYDEDTIFGSAYNLNDLRLEDEYFWADTSVVDRVDGEIDWETDEEDEYEDGVQDLISLDVKSKSLPHGVLLNEVTPGARVIVNALRREYHGEDLRRVWFGIQHVDEFDPESGEQRPLGWRVMTNIQDN